MAPRARILVVDDKAENRELLRAILEPEDYSVIEATEGSEAIAVATHERPDVILLDVQLPGMDGYEVCRQLKQMSETSSIPILFVTAIATGEEDQIHGLDVGGYDFLVKPIARGVLLARVAVMVRIRRIEDRIRQLSMVDDFTGLYSKKYVLHRLEEELNRAQRATAPIVVTMIDLDGFKQFNDSFGHMFGDRVLRHASATLKAGVRGYDSVGRYGGDEFLILLPGIGEAEAVKRIERLREMMRNTTFGEIPEAPPVDFSAGVAEWDHRSPADELVDRADQALYAAKDAGRGCTVAYADLESGRIAAGSS